MGRVIIAPIGVLIGLTVASVVMFVALPTAFLPEEDNGYFIGAISLPEGSVNIRTNAAIKEFLAYMGKDDAVEQTFGVTGSDILSGGQKPNAGLSFIKLKPWDERKGAASQVGALIGKAAAYNATHPDVNIMALNPPSIPGLGSSGGFSMYIQNKNGDSNENMQRVIGQFLGAANRRPEIKMAYTTFRMDTPSYNFDIDREKALKMVWRWEIFLQPYRSIMGLSKLMILLPMDVTLRWSPRLMWIIVWILRRISS